MSAVLGGGATSALEEGMRCMSAVLGGGATSALEEGMKIDVHADMLTHNT